MWGWGHFLLTLIPTRYTYIICCMQKIITFPLKMKMNRIRTIDLYSKFLTQLIIICPKPSCNLLTSLSCRCFSFEITNLKFLTFYLYFDFLIFENPNVQNTISTILYFIFPEYAK